MDSERVSDVMGRMVDLLRRRLGGLRLVYWFGSTATGTAFCGDDSDLDIAFYAMDPVGGSLRYELLIEASVMAGCSVDLVDLRAASTVLMWQVLESGRLVYESDPRFTADFEVMILARYCALTEERHELLESIQQQGYIHA